MAAAYSGHHLFNRIKFLLIFFVVVVTSFGWFGCDINDPLPDCQLNSSSSHNRQLFITKISISHTGSIENIHTKFYQKSVQASRS